MAQREDLQHLRERVERATELDAELFREVVYEVMENGGDLSAAFARRREVLELFAVGARLDAALALVERVLPAANCMGVERSPAGWTAYVSRNYVHDGHWLYEAEARPTAPLALLSALLRALEGEKS